MNLLHINSSILGANSASRAVTAEIVRRQRAIHLALEVAYHDLSAEPPQQLSGSARR